jgi:uncharacterized protein
VTIDAPEKQLVRGFLTAFYAGDIAGALAHCDDAIDFLAHAPVEMFPHFGPRRGKAAVTETWQALHRRYSSMRHEVLSLITEDNRAAAIIKLNLRKRGSERIIQTSIADFYTFERGRIATISQFFDSFDAVEQSLERDIADLLTRPH